MKSLQKGFTLIELMIVVAIIGILASIALPAYQDYLARSQAIESVVLLDYAKTPIEDYTTQNGVFPNGTAGVDDLATFGLIAQGTYGALSEPAQSAIDGGSITYTFGSGGVNVNANLNGQSVIYTRSASVGGVTGTWSCSTSAGLAQKFRPHGC